MASVFWTLVAFLQMLHQITVLYVSYRESDNDRFSVLNESEQNSAWSRLLQSCCCQLSAGICGEISPSSGLLTLLARDEISCFSFLCPCLQLMRSMYREHNLQTEHVGFILSLSLQMICQDCCWHHLTCVTKRTKFYIIWVCCKKLNNMRNSDFFYNFKQTNFKQMHVLEDEENIRASLTTAAVWLHTQANSSRTKELIFFCHNTSS